MWIHLQITFSNYNFLAQDYWLLLSWVVASMVLILESLHFGGHLYYINIRNSTLVWANIEVCAILSSTRPCKVQRYAYDRRAGFTGFAMPSTELTWRYVVSTSWDWDHGRLGIHSNHSSWKLSVGNFLCQETMIRTHLTLEFTSEFLNMVRWGVSTADLQGRYIYCTSWCNCHKIQEHWD